MAVKETVEQRWTKTNEKQLVGKTIKSVRYMTEDEARETMWYNRPVVIAFTDGTYIIPQSDDEGNDGGAIYCSDGSLIPVMR
tara:strand:- start:53 stop:298 length:246 start_codon:yes stop_codon:yes gene_type:complete